MDSKFIMIIFILFFLSAIPTIQWRNSPVGRDMIPYMATIHIIFTVIAIFVYYTFFNNQNNTIFLIIFGSIFVFICIMEIYIHDRIELNLLKKNILKIPNFMNMTEGQIRRELYKMPDESPDMKTIKKALKKIGYYDV